MTIQLKTKEMKMEKNKHGAMFALTAVLTAIFSISCLAEKERAVISD